MRRGFLTSAGSAVLALLVALWPPVLGLARAGETSVAGLKAHHLDLLPLNELDRGELARDHPKLAQRLYVLKQRATTLRQWLEARPDAADEGSRKLAQQIAATEQALLPLLAALLEKANAPAIDDALLAHIASAPAGPMHEARYAHGLVLFVPGLPAPQRVLFERLVPQVDGALLALARQRERLGNALKPLDLGADRVRAFQAGLDQELRAIDRRFWRLVDYVVPQAQRAAIHRILPGASYQRHENIVAHLYALPGLTASQGVRLRSLLTEVEAESSPESALMRRLQSELGDRALDGAVRARLQEELQAAQYRVLDLQRYAVGAAREILTAEQWTALEAIPPRVSPSDRKQDSVQVLEGIVLDASQRERLGILRAGLADARREVRERRLAAAAMGAAYGPDSPQMMSMMMAMARVEAESGALQRDFNGRLFMELLTPEQVARWVLEPR